MQDKKRRRVRIITSTKDLNTVLGLLNVDEEVNVEVEVSVEDSKNTYKILNAPAVLDWDFLDERIDSTNVERITETLEKEKPQPKAEDNIMKDFRTALKQAGEEGIDEMTDEKIERMMLSYYQSMKTMGMDVAKEEEDNKFYFPSHEIISDTTGLVKIIESVWLASKAAPAVRFGTKLFEGNFRKAWNNVTIEENTKTDLNHSTTRAMMKLLVNVFYNQPEDENELATAYYDTLERIKENFDSLKSAETLNQVMNILYRHESKKI